MSENNYYVTITFIIMYVCLYYVLEVEIINIVRVVVVGHNTLF